MDASPTSSGAASIAAKTRTETIAHCRREIAFYQAESRRLRDEIYQLRLKAERAERYADEVTRTLGALLALEQEATP